MSGTWAPSAGGLGVAPLCAVDAPVAEYIDAASEAGFVYLGVRLSPVTSQDVRYRPDSAQFRELRAAVDGSGLHVLDAEVFVVEDGTDRDVWLPVLEMAAELGASLLNVVGRTTELERFAALAGSLTEDAAQHAITPVLEPIAYARLDSFDAAISIARSVGCQVELDALHVVRTGADLELLRANRELFPVLQLCDARAHPRRWDEDRPARAGATDSDAILESRFDRLLPGRGIAPLDELLSLLEPGARVSVEIPNVDLQRGRTTAEYLAFLHAESTTYLDAWALRHALG